MLTDSQIRSAKPSDRPRKFKDARGLYLQVMPNGGRYWRFNYRFGGKQKTLALGIYPDVSLARARERLQTAREQLAEGIDPAVEKQATNKSFESVAREWYLRWKAGRNERHMRAQAEAVAAQFLKDRVVPEDGRQTLVETRRRVEAGWKGASEILIRQGDVELAAEVKRFVNAMPPSRTQREWMAESIIARARGRSNQPVPTR